VTLNRTILIVVAIVIGAMCLAACKPSDASLTTNDLTGLANLSAVDRTAFTDSCVAHRSQLFDYLFNGRSSAKPEEVREMKGEIDETFPRFCGCLVHDLEKRASKMQLRMAETMIDQGTYILNLGSPIPEFETLKKEAAQLGMSTTDFEGARQSFRIHAYRAAESCSLMLSAPAIARTLNLPEKHWYPGPPEEPKDTAPAKLKGDRFIQDQAARAYSLCLPGGARRLARNSDDPPEAIERGALALCAKNKQMILDAYGGSADSSSFEIVSSLEKEFRRELPQIVVKTREAVAAQRAAQPTNR
jgi:hypothetical protein